MNRVRKSLILAGAAPLLVALAAGAADEAHEDAAVTPEPAEAAAACTPPVVAILPAFDQGKDMAQGLENAPLAARDSKGLSRAELWQEVPLPDGFVQLVNVRPLPNGIKVAAARTSNTAQSIPVISKPHDPSSFEQKWARKSISGFVSYQVPFGDKRITYKPGDPTAPFRQQTATEGQLFKVKVTGCL